MPTTTALPKRVKNLTGMRRGKLVAKFYIGTLPNRHANWLCACDCGRKHEVDGATFLRGSCLSCGCYRDSQVSAANSTHGMTGTPEYQAWLSIKQRTTNAKHKAYRRYGGRGIKMWEGWLDDFPAFFAHVGLRPSPLHSLDRIDNEKGYVPGNLAWRTQTEQQRNRSTNKLITFGNESLTAGQWGERIGVSDCAIWARIRIWGWSIEKAVTTPSKRIRKNQNENIPGYQVY